MKTKPEKGRLEPLFKSPDGSISYISDGNFIFADKEGARIRLDLFAGRYYKLRPVNGVPILEVDGLRMHLIRDFRTPLDYSREVVNALGIPDGLPSGKNEGYCVLDTCMGLGYTAIAAAKKGSVRLVATCELSEAVISLTRWNPFSDGLWAKEGKITVLQGNSAELIKTFEGSMFSFVIHDPPRLSHAPELYSGPFYSELLRVLEPGGRLFHYVGSVGEKRGRRIDREAALRLQKAGFVDIIYSPKLQGLLASRPRITHREVRSQSVLPSHIRPRTD